MAVVGKGLIGAACARHLSLMCKAKVVLVGPDEPTDWQSHNGVFASSYDSGRITRVLDTDKIWGLLAKRSIERYADIEKQSGLSLFHPVGCMKVVPDNSWGENYLSVNETVGKLLGATFRRLPWVALQDEFPNFQFNQRSIAILETQSAGWIDPRKLVIAQTCVAEQQGVQVLKETVVDKIDTGGAVELRTDRGTTFSAGRIIICAGAFSNFHSLTSRKLKLILTAETTALATVSAEHGHAMSDTPALIWFLENQPFHYIYLMPPIMYPDGHYYLKIGGDLETDHTFNDLDSLKNWFHSNGGAQAANLLRSILQNLLPRLRAESWSSKPCVITKTVTERPYIGRIDERTYVATGGCGAAAKSSDEIGRLGALCLINQAADLNFEKAYDESYSKDEFEVVFEDTPNAAIVAPKRKFHF